MEDKRNNKQDNKEKKYYSVSKISYTIRVFVALYLLYTVWQLRATPFETEGTERVIFIIAIVLFSVFAIIIGGTSMKALIKKEYSENNPKDDEDQGLVISSISSEVREQLEDREGREEAELSEDTEKADE